MPFPFLAAATLAGGALGALASKDASDSAVEAAEVANQPELWKPAQPYVNQMMGDARNYYNQGLFSPPANQMQMDSRQGLLDYGQQQLPGLIDAAQGSWMQGLSGEMNPMVGAMIDASNKNLMQEYQRGVLPRIASNAVGAGQFGGSRQGIATGLASEGLLEAMSNSQTELLNNAYNQSQDQQRSAWGVMPSMLGAGRLPSDIQGEVGGLFRQDVMNPVNNLAGYQQAMAPWTGLTSTGPNVPPQYNPMWGGLGGAMTAYNWANNQQQQAQIPAAVPSPTTAPTAAAPTGWAQLQNSLWG